MGDTPAESRRVGKLIIEMNRIEIAAEFGKRANVCIRYFFRQRSGITDLYVHV